MKKVKLLSFIAIGMMVVNLAILAFLFSNRLGPPKGEGPKRIVIEKLGFDKAQVDAYEKLIDKHKTEIDKTQEELKKLKNTLFRTLRSDNDLSRKDELIEEMGDLQIRMEQIHYAHFQGLKSICKPDQMEAYDELCLEIARLFAPHPPKRRK